MGFQKYYVIFYFLSMAEGTWVFFLLLFFKFYISTIVLFAHIFSNKNKGRGRLHRSQAAYSPTWALPEAVTNLPQPASFSMGLQVASLFSGGLRTCHQ